MKAIELNSEPMFAHPKDQINKTQAFGKYGSIASTLNFHPRKTQISEHEKIVEQEVEDGHDASSIRYGSCIANAS